MKNSEEKFFNVVGVVVGVGVGVVVVVVVKNSCFFCCFVFKNSFLPLAIFFFSFSCLFEKPQKPHNTTLSCQKKREEERDLERERGSFVGSSEIPSGATSRDHRCPQDFEINRFDESVSSISLLRVVVNFITQLPFELVRSKWTFCFTWKEIERTRTTTTTQRKEARGDAAGFTRSRTRKYKNKNNALNKPL